MVCGGIWSVVGFGPWWDLVRSRAKGDAVALTPACRETLDRQAALLRQAGSFRSLPEAFAPLLAGRRDLDDFEDLYERALRHRQAATVRNAHRSKREAERPAVRPAPGPEMRREESIPDRPRAGKPAEEPAGTRTPAPGARAHRISGNGKSGSSTRATRAL